MNSPSEDITDILLESDAGLDLVFGKSLFFSKEPDDKNTQDKVVTVYDTGGDEPVAQYFYEYPNVQIRIRGDKFKYKEAYSLLNSIKNELHGTNNKTINGARYVGIWASSDIISLGYDEENRPILTVNFRLQRTIAA